LFTPSITRTLATSQDPATEASGDGELRTDAIVNLVLDEAVPLDLEQTPLAELLERIEAEVGVPFHVSERTYALLPYGRQTPISVTVTATPLRETLRLITQRLGLVFEVRPERVEILPMDALTRAGRRATVEEIAMLDLLNGVELDLVDDRPTIAQLLEEVDLKLQALDVMAAEQQQQQPGFVVENRLGETLRDQRVFIARNATLYEAMEAIHEQSAATWYPWGDTLIVLAKDGWIRRMLERPISLAYDRVELSQVLLDLQRLAGVPFQIEPGVIQTVPEEFRRIRELYLENEPVRGALEAIGAVTGLSYTVTPQGVLIHTSRSNTAAGDDANPAAGRTARPLLSIDLGDGTSLLLYESDLPETLRQRLEAERAAAIDRLSRSLGATDDSDPTTSSADGR
jgi:hypothetical protein